MQDFIVVQSTDLIVAQSKDLIVAQSWKFYIDAISTIAGGQE